MIAHKDEWDYNSFVPQLKNQSVLVVSADDQTRPANDSFVTAMKSAGATRMTTVHLPTDHTFNGHRIALQVAVLDWLNTLKSWGMPGKSALKLSYQAILFIC
jgi:hypothetical protein